MLGMSSVSEIAKRLDQLLLQPASAGQCGGLLAEIEQVQLDCLSARRTAEQTLADAVERREALLMTADDDAVLAIDRDVNLAAINLERLDSLEPQVNERLRKLRPINNELQPSHCAIPMSFQCQEG